MINYTRLGYEIKRDFTNFSLKISKGLKRPQQKFVHQMVYGILAGNKLHLSEIARSLKENITLKKTIDRLSRNLGAFDGKQVVMQDYLSLVKQHIKEDYAQTSQSRQAKSLRHSLKYGMGAPVKSHRAI